MRRDKSPVDEPAPTADPTGAGISAYFCRHPGAGLEELTPLPVSLSGWGTEHMRGSAVTGALARSAELAGGRRPGLRPVRFTVDLHTAATMATVFTRSTVLREGGRLMLVDSELLQDGCVMARARTLFLPTVEQDIDCPPWLPDRTPSTPSDHLQPITGEGRLFYSDGSGWDPDAGRHRNSERKQVWCRAIPLVAGEKATSFQAAATVADLTNLVTHWGTEGVCHINADVTLVLARTPDVLAMGVSATGRVGAGSPSVGAAEMYDKHGVFGYATVATLLQPDRPMDTVTQLMRGPAIRDRRRKREDLE
ncbi:acyl-CoA thioesterase domain-containing protein [Rhodococcus sp. 2H158]